MYYSKVYHYAPNQVIKYLQGWRKPMKSESAKVIQVGDVESPNNIYFECLRTGNRFRIQLITDVDLAKYGVICFERHIDSDSIAGTISFSSFSFRRSFGFLDGSKMTTFDGTEFLKPGEVLEKLGLVVTEDIRLLMPDFMEYLERNYVYYESDAEAHLACENYIDHVIRYFRYELIEKPRIESS